MGSRLEKKIAAIKKRIVELGPVHPGRISQQYNICGTPGCRCKDPKDPRKHGPYHNLSYTFQRKGRTLFIRKELVQEMKKRTERYQRLKKLIEELVEANVTLAREEVLDRKGSNKKDRKEVDGLRVQGGR